MTRKSKTQTHDVLEFDPRRALARALITESPPKTGRILRLLTGLGSDRESVYTGLFTPFLEGAYRAGETYIGRGYGASSDEEVQRIVEHCHSRKLMQKAALQKSRAFLDAPKSRHVAALVDQGKFDAYLRRTLLPQLHEEVASWFSPVPVTQSAVSNRRLSVFRNLPQEVQVIVLYLAYRVGSRHHDGLRWLVTMLDWDYLARVLRHPKLVARYHVGAMQAAMQLKLVLRSGTRDFLVQALTDQPTVGQRALAEEYEHIVGKRMSYKPASDVQKTMLDHTDADNVGLSALCLSGGGIRSASFCLGVIQTLATYRLFGRFHYLSTVSGGGYIGTGLTRWMAGIAESDCKPTDDCKAQHALQYAEEQLSRLRRADYIKDRMSGTTFEHEGPLTWLRMNSNYLARQLSLFSADAWTVVATYLRNLAVTWLIFWPWFALFLALPWLAVLFGQQHAFIGLDGPFDLGFATICRASMAGLVGALLGVVGASYYFQGSPNGSPSVGKVYANKLRWPGDGDARAAFGALLLITGCILLSSMMWSDVDDGLLGDSFPILARFWTALVAALSASQLPWLRDLGHALSGDSLALLRHFWHYMAAAAAIVGTQMVLATLNVDPNKSRSRLVMPSAAFLAALTQIGLVLWIRWGLSNWSPNKIDIERLALSTTVRALATPPLLLLALLIGEAVKAAVRSYTEPADRREHQARAHAFSFMLMTAWIVCAVLVIAVPALLSFLGDSVPGATAAGSGLSVALSGWFGYRKSTPGKPETRTPISMTLVGGIGMLLLAILLSLGAWKTFEHTAMFPGWQMPVRCQCMNLKPDEQLTVASPKYDLPGFKLPVSDSICKIPKAQCVDRSFVSYFNALVGQFDTERLSTVLSILLFTALVAFGLGFVIRMNEFSLHGFYRDRLIRAFYGGFRSLNDPRKPALFTGFDSKDDIPFSHVKDALYKCAKKFDSNHQPSKPPFLVVNTALNLVKGTELAWQERKADSFTMTALRAGNYRLGYRDIHRFADNVNLGTAMAISGAAFNPNMGYNSSGPLAFLMSVLNVRLGWWLGNPKFADWIRKDPSSSSWRLLQEAAGQTTDTDHWIHLSDGGHFDNMGLWEMVHRRCRFILLVDASQDAHFAMEDLYSAIRKIRIDMGIEISAEQEPVMLFPRSARAVGLCHARFTIRYSGFDKDSPTPGPNGQLIYLKPCIYGSEPPDIEQYAQKHPDFPHEPTADQFFNESQFESYRKLGEWEMLQLLMYATGARSPGELAESDGIELVAKGKRRGLFTKV
ncbi:hypothetical protein [Caballeronia sp. HLA56]